MHQLAFRNMIEGESEEEDVVESLVLLEQLLNYGNSVRRAG